MQPGRQKPVVLLVDGTHDNLLLLNELLKGKYEVRAAGRTPSPGHPAVLRARVRTRPAPGRSRDRLEEEVRQQTRDISRLQEAAVTALAALAEIRDRETGEHLRRTKRYIRELAGYMGRTAKFRRALPPKKVDMIALSAPLHDIGKVGIPDRILLKPGALTAEEYEVMKKHTTMGRDALSCAERLIGGAENFLGCAREIAYSHHEKWNGTGYPRGLAGEEIPLSARLMAVADAYDAITTRRVYKPAKSHGEAVAIIRSDAGGHFDPDVVEAFLCLQEKFKKISALCADPPAACPHGA